jgi:plastocyanin
VVWKIAIPSIAIVIGSFVIAGAIVAAQVLSGNIPDDDRPPRNETGLPPAFDGIRISIADNARDDSYRPNLVNIKTGETITWVNDDSMVHTATANDRTFDSGVLMKGDAFSFTFDKEGKYAYYCDVHPNMVGTVTVSS